MIKITYFTDPYCSWCWATEPVLMRLQETYRDQVKVRYVLGGLVRLQVHEFLDARRAIGTVRIFERSASAGFFSFTVPRKAAVPVNTSRA